jgi:hypothetical protein
MELRIVKITPVELETSIVLKALPCANEEHEIAGKSVFLID